MINNERGYTFTPLVLFFGLWLIFSALLMCLTPLPAWASVILGLAAMLLFLRVADAVFSR
jgi:hypothetical protein